MERDKTQEHHELLYDILVITVILLFTVIIRSYRLGFPSKMYFDEIYYAKGAQNYIDFELDTNWVHPPLGKILIAGGMLLYRSFTKMCAAMGLMPKMNSAADWRIASLITGSMMIPILYFMALRMFRSRYIATVSIFLLSIEFLHFAESRIAMLDIFVCFFILVGFYFAYCYIMSEERLLRYVILSACCFGLATACKWSGLFGAIGAFSAILFLKKEECRKEIIKRPESKRHDRNHFFTDVVRKLPETIKIGLIFLFCGLLIQILAYVPFFVLGGTFTKLLGYYTGTLRFQYKDVWEHPYLSQMWAWPTMIRPIWYLFDESFGKVYGIIAMGSPLFWWGFLIFLIELFILAIQERKKLQIFLLIGYLSPYVFWGISNHGGFFYYMTPCVPWMALITAYGLERWRDTLSGRIMGWIYLAALMLFFVVFFPILSGYPIPRIFFNKLMWTRSWI